MSVSNPLYNKQISFPEYTTVIIEMESALNNTSVSSPTVSLLESVYVISVLLSLSVIVDRIFGNIWSCRAYNIVSRQETYLKTVITGNKSILPTLDKWQWQVSTSKNPQISVEGLPNCINYVYTAIAQFNTMISNKRFLKANLNSATL